MKVADLMAAMAAAGAPMDAIILAVRALEEKDAQIEARRASEAARTRRYRERGGGAIPEDMRQQVFARDGYACVDCGCTDHLQCDHIHPVSKGGETSLENLQTLCRPCNARKKDRIRKRDVRGMSADTGGTSSESPAPTPSPSPPNENNLTPHTLTPGKEKPTRAKPAHRMPEDWQPQPVEGEVGAAISRWPPGSIERELGRFRDWALSASGPNARKSDWQAAWRNWLRKAEDEGRYRNGQRNGSPQRLGGNGGGSSLSGHGRTVDAMQLALQRATAGGTH